LLVESEKEIKTFLDNINQKTNKKEDKAEMTKPTNRVFINGI